MSGPFVQRAGCRCKHVQVLRMLAQELYANAWFGSRLSLVVTRRRSFKSCNTLVLPFLHGGGAYGIDPPLKQS